ncbi:MAG TPA: J domain-containing protein [Alphaproteobacteria bacterium]|nr:J domain-containing protein [Alphaproteobacteria bacterium]
MPPFEDSYFLTSDRPVKLRGCDCPGCNLPADYRAPKSREHLNEYYWFCLDHVREYNKQWDYFAGMSGAAIEDHIRKASVWERPSWPIGGWRAREQSIRDEVMSEFFAEEVAAEQAQASSSSTSSLPKAERDALEILELRPPVTLIAIKAQYKRLVKQHHPDANGGSTESEEKFKNINQAFTILKQLYETGEL